MGLFTNVLSEVKEGVSDVGEKLVDRLTLQIKFAVFALGAGLLVIMGIVLGVAELLHAPVWSVSLTMGLLGFGAGYAWLQARDRRLAAETQAEVQEAKAEIVEAALGGPPVERDRDANSQQLNP